MRIYASAFHAMEADLEYERTDGVAGGESFSGKEYPSNMVAEGTCDPSSGLPPSSLRVSDNHDLQLMAGSRPMGAKDLEDYIKDITLMEEPYLTILKWKSAP